MISKGLNRRSVLSLSAGAALGFLARPAFSADLPFRLRGRFEQSGYAVGQADPDAELWLNGTLRGHTSPEGWFYIGIDRDGVSPYRIEIRTPAGSDSFDLAFTPRLYDVQRVDGLPPETVTPTAPEVLERIKRDSALKAEAFASRDTDDTFKGGFIYPLKNFIVSGQFGNQRVLNGVPKSPHYGFDMAAPIGTPIYAPQGGLVVLAEPDLFYEGGLTFIDHGLGVISMYLHQSNVLVQKGDRVVQGQLLGLVGAKGRATGPHLCWRLKWGDFHMDPSFMVTSV
ncbi:M23 family metallopeptidase [Asticcacaulis benevestitus]|uniref:M23ase beta-sheet core domain-containing protein n=1 Tax=Asticcacaulis benevestitus DSM 16100 = ATCC BAA-896 TaxID=1121022 RepID=V4PE89_9CAUL|nr:M23 family metallopeptidase [Asticcacaulis benevestitus]ESQ86421.1 hypothetical protein ABENE_18510 [Asticcacaulis benevestitus DSM 16100 = ATCC BAA-896]